MKGVSTSIPRRKTVRAEGGLTWGEFDAATQEHGLAVTGGRVSTTGIAGLTLGSGSGWLERKFGFVCDNLIKAEVVTADGEQVVASEDENAGPLLGPARRRRQLRHRHRVPPPAPRARPDRVRRHAHVPRRDGRRPRCASTATSWTNAPDEVCSGLAFITAPPEEFVPEPVRGQPVIGVVCLYAGPGRTTARPRSRPCASSGLRASTCSARCRTSRSQQLLDGAAPKGMQNYWTADFLAELPDKAVDVLVEHATAAGLAADPGHPGARRRRARRGSTTTRPRSGSATRRGTSTSSRCGRTRPTPSATSRTPATIAAAMKPWTTGRAYLNFIGDEGGDRVEAAFGPEKYQPAPRAEAEVGPAQPLPPQPEHPAGRVSALEHRPLGSLGPVSVLSLGGGGLGQVWGPTDRDEAVATVHAAVAAGIDLLDLAPMYGRGESERVVAEAFAGRLPAGVRVSTKVMLGDPVDERPEDRIRRSLERSLETLQLDRVDLCFLHTYIVDDGRVLPQLGEHQHRRATSWTTYADAWRPTMAALVDEGIVGAWGITGTGPPDTVLARACATSPDRRRCRRSRTCSTPPARSAATTSRPGRARSSRSRPSSASACSGIRAVGAGAITDALDRDVPADDPVAVDFARAEPVRAIARALGMSTAALAHRYALTMPGVDSVVLGVKNRAELAECVAAAAAGPLPDDVMAAIDTPLPPDRHRPGDRWPPPILGWLSGGTARRLMGRSLTGSMPWRAPVRSIPARRSPCAEPGSSRRAVVARRSASRWSGPPPRRRVRRPRPPARAGQPGAARRRLAALAVDRRRSPPRCRPTGGTRPSRPRRARRSAPGPPKMARLVARRRPGRRGGRARDEQLHRRVPAPRRGHRPAACASVPRTTPVVWLNVQNQPTLPGPPRVRERRARRRARSAGPNLTARRHERALPEPSRVAHRRRAPLQRRRLRSARRAHRASRSRATR